MILTELLQDALFAALAGVGFGAISQPPRRAFMYIALLAAVGHSFRWALINLLGVDLATASLFAALLIGGGSMPIGKYARCPMTVLYIPALLPMIPGKIAYTAVFSLIMFLQTQGDTSEAGRYLELFLSNGLTALLVVFFLAVGATMPMFVFPGKAYSLTRRRKTVAR